MSRCANCGSDMNGSYMAYCATCRQVDAINKQTKQLASSDPTPSYNTKSSDMSVVTGIVWLIGLGILYKFLCWAWEGMISFSNYVVDHKWWFIGLGIFIVIGIIGAISDGLEQK